MATCKSFRGLGLNGWFRVIGAMCATFACVGIAGCVGAAGGAGNGNDNAANDNGSAGNGNDNGGGDVSSVRLVEVADGLSSPVDLTHAGDGSGRLFVVEQTGTIRVIDGSGVLLDEPFLDLADTIVPINSGFDERGLLGLAFHPDFAANGRFFVRYSAPLDGAGGTSGGSHDEVLAEFTVAGDPTVSNVADRDSERVLFRVNEPQSNHNGGGVAFGSDGYLYFSLGDGGGANDGLDDNPPSHGPMGNGQNIETALGAILRIDVNATPGDGLEYAIPADNPFAAADGLDEVYAYGLRNPYRFSFDDGPGGDGALYVADVGQNLFEEVNVVTRGGNYGWVIREGFACFDPFSPGNPPATCDEIGPSGEPLIDPVMAYDHSVGVAVIGGFVYRGSNYSQLAGKYVFGDFGLGFPARSGRLFVADIDGPKAFNRRALEIAANGVPFTGALLGIGEDESGELYVLASNGSVLRFAAP